MANEVSTDIVFYSENGKALRNLRYLLKEATQENVWTDLQTVLGNLAKDLKDSFFNEQDRVSLVNGTQISVVSTTGGVSYFSLYQLDSGSYNVESWKMYLDKTNPDIKLKFSAVEPGMEIFCTNDESGEFFPERYHIDINLPKNSDLDLDQPELYELEYETDLNSLEDVVDLFYRITGKYLSSVDEITEYLNDYIQNLEESQTSEDYWISINKYSIVD